jgi:hypothetical protein
MGRVVRWFAGVEYHLCPGSKSLGGPRSFETGRIAVKEIDRFCKGVLKVVRVVC